MWEEELIHGARVARVIQLGKRESVFGCLKLVMTCCVVSSLVKLGSVNSIQQAVLCRVEMRVCPLIAYSYKDCATLDVMSSLGELRGR